MSLQFEWDLKKAEANEAKHGISFPEALTVFADPLVRIFEDAEHSVTNGGKLSSGTHLGRI
jgi:uncharacterized protein